MLDAVLRRRWRIAGPLGSPCGGRLQTTSSGVRLSAEGRERRGKGARERVRWGSGRRGSCVERGKAGPDTAGCRGVGGDRERAQAAETVRR